MNKNLIKIVKGGEKLARKLPIAPETIKSKKDAGGDFAATVNHWIDERRKNRRTEKIFSDDKIAAWQLLP